MAGCKVQRKMTVMTNVIVITSLLFMALTVAVASSDSSSVPSGPLRHLFKGTYVLYANGVHKARVWLPVLSNLSIT